MLSAGVSLIFDHYARSYVKIPKRKTHINEVV